MRRNLKKKINKTNIIQIEKKFKNSYVELCTAWEDCIMVGCYKTSDFETTQKYFKTAADNNKKVLLELSSFVKFPIKYHRFCKLIDSKRFDIILEKFPDLAFKFIFKSSPHDNSIELGTHIIHGIQFTKVNSLKPSSTNVTCKIKYDKNMNEDLSNSEISTINQKTNDTMNIIGKDLLNCKKLFNEFKIKNNLSINNTDEHIKLFREYIKNNSQTKKFTESDSDTISQTINSENKLLKWIKNIEQIEYVENTENIENVENIKNIERSMKKIL